MIKEYSSITEEEEEGRNNYKCVVVVVVVLVVSFGVSFKCSFFTKKLKWINFFNMSTFFHFNKKVCISRPYVVAICEDIPGFWPLDPHWFPFQFLLVYGAGIELDSGAVEI